MSHYLGLQVVAAEEEERLLVVGTTLLTWALDSLSNSSGIVASPGGLGSPRPVSQLGPAPGAAAASRDLVALLPPLTPAVHAVLMRLHTRMLIQFGQGCQVSPAWVPCCTLLHSRHEGRSHLLCLPLALGWYGTDGARPWHSCPGEHSAVGWVLLDGPMGRAGAPLPRDVSQQGVPCAPVAHRTHPSFPKNQ